MFFGDPSTFTIISDLVGGINAAFSGDPVPGLTFIGGFDANPASFPTVDFVADSGLFGDVNFDNTLVEWFQISDLPSTTVTIGGGPVSPNAPATFIDLGTLGNIGDPLVFDTLGSINNFGSTADTDVGLYAASGEFLDENDDGPTDVTSLLEFPEGGESIAIDASGNLSFENLTLGAGDYFLVVDEFDTVFGEDFAISAGLEADETLDVDLNLNGSLIQEFTVTDAGPVFLRFTLVPEPGTALAAVAVAPLLMRRRRA